MSSKFKLLTALLVAETQAITTSLFTPTAGGPWPTTGPEAMLVGFVNEAPWGYTVAKQEATAGRFVIEPLKEYPAAGTKLDENYAFKVVPSPGGIFKAAVVFNGTGSGLGNLNRNFGFQMSGGSSQFGVSVSHSMATTISMSNIFEVGNASHFTAVYTVTVAANRPRSATCRAAALRLCGSPAPDPMPCEACIVQHRLALEDEGCDFSHPPTDLDSLTCPNTPPSAACLAAVGTACSASLDSGWLACNNCIDEHSASIRKACNDTHGHETKILYGYCVDKGPTQRSS